MNFGFCVSMKGKTQPFKVKMDLISVNYEHAGQDLFCFVTSPTRNLICAGGIGAQMNI